MSGGTPSTPDKSQRGDVREPANTRQQETESMRVHRRLQAKKAKRCNTGTSSRDLAQFSTKLHASALQRPPVSMATTTNLHLRPSTSSAYFLSASCIGDRPVHHRCIWASSPTCCNGAPQCDIDCGAFPNCRRNHRTHSELLQCPMGAVIVSRSLCRRLVVTT